MLLELKILVRGSNIRLKKLLLSKPFFSSKSVSLKKQSLKNISQEVFSKNANYSNAPYHIKKVTCQPKSVNLGTYGRLVNKANELVKFIRTIIAILLLFSYKSVFLTAACCPSTHTHPPPP